MKLLIVAPSRVGGRNLSKWLSMELKMPWIHEPFHFHEQTYIQTIDDLKSCLKNDNILVKVNYGDWKENFYDSDFFNIFDKIICLTREDTFEASISFTIAYQTKNFTESYTIKNNWIENNFTEIKLNQTYLDEVTEQTKNIKNSLQITYEGVYVNKNDINRIKEYLDISELKHENLLDYNLRYRKQRML